VAATGIAEEDWSERYVTSLYWAVYTMLAIGYGDIVIFSNNS
jgi:hypothetical protein